MNTEIVCKVTGYVVEGLTAIRLWGDEDAVIPMEPVKFDHEPSEQEIRDAVNDNGFGCQFYYGAVIRVDARYEHGARVSGDEVKFVNFGHASDNKVLDILAYGHSESKVSVWELEGEVYDKWANRAA